MIIGIGSDLCNIERIQGSLDRFGERFVNRVFTDLERAKAERRELTRAGTYAKRFAAKEAFFQGGGHRLQGGRVHEGHRRRQPAERCPTLVLTGGAKARLDALTPPGHAVDVHLTMTDDHPWAQAFVILYARPL